MARFALCPNSRTLLIASTRRLGSGWSISLTHWSSDLPPIRADGLGAELAMPPDVPSGAVFCPDGWAGAEAASAERRANASTVRMLESRYVTLPRRQDTTRWPRKERLTTEAQRHREGKTKSACTRLFSS